MSQRALRSRDLGSSSVMQRAAAPGKRTKTMGMSSRSSGSAMPAPVQAKMESSFGADFSAVRIHEGPEAQSVGARAYAQGTDLFFAPGEYAPHSASGQELLGHELAHVVQQSQGRVTAPTQAKGINSDDSLEREADLAGSLAARGEPTPLSASSISALGGGPLQRKVVFDTIFTDNTAKLEKQAQALQSLRATVALIETHPLNELTMIDVFVEGGEQNQNTKMGSTVIQSIDGESARGQFDELPMTERIIRAYHLQIGVRVNVPDYEEYGKDSDYYDEDSLGDMIATFLHEVHMHVLPKMDQLVTLKKSDPGSKHIPLGKETLIKLSPHMAQIMGASDIDEHDDPASWTRLLDAVERVAIELSQSEDQPKWGLAYATLNSVVNDVMTHTIPDPIKHNLPNLTPNMPLEQKLQLFNRADQLALLFKKIYSEKFPLVFAQDEDMNSDNSDDDLEKID